MLETIDFEKDNLKGQKFVEIFSKENFNFEKLNEFTQNSLNKINRKKEQIQLQENILSQGYELKVLELIKLNFLNEYDGEMIDNVLQNISIKISPKNENEIQIPKIHIETSEQTEIKSERDNTKYIINKNGKKLAKNKFVLEFVRLYLKENPLTFAELKNIFVNEYQGSIGVINELEFVETKYANKSNKRHFTGNENILTSNDNVKFVVSTEWGKGNVEKIVDLARKKGFEIDEI